jgi:hypothetical protein
MLVIPATMIGGSHGLRPARQKYKSLPEKQTKDKQTGVWSSGRVFVYQGPELKPYYYQKIKVPNA